MCRGSCFRTYFSEHTFQTFSRKQFLTFGLSIRDGFSWKMSLLVTSEILRLFGNLLTAADKYSDKHVDKTYSKANI